MGFPSALRIFFQCCPGAASSFEDRHFWTGACLGPRGKSKAKTPAAPALAHPFPHSEHGGSTGSTSCPAQGKS